jgi:hypothetical protein
LRLARHLFGRPEQSHRRSAIVASGQRRLAREVDAAIAVADEGRVALPARRAGQRLRRRDAHLLVRRESPELDRNRLVDQSNRLVNEDHRVLRTGAQGRGARAHITHHCDPPPS